MQVIALPVNVFQLRHLASTSNKLESLVNTFRILPNEMLLKEVWETEHRNMNCFRFFSCKTLVRKKKIKNNNKSRINTTQYHSKSLTSLIKHYFSF